MNSKAKENLFKIWESNGKAGRDSLWYKIGGAKNDLRISYPDFRAFYKKLKEGWTPVIQDKLASDKSFLSIATANDFHSLEHDPVTFELFLQFLKDSNPDEVVIHEVFDFNELSSFKQNPYKRSGLQDDIDCGDYLIRRIREVIGPDKDIHMPISNHDFRKDRYIFDHHELKDLRLFTEVSEFLGLQDLNVILHPDTYIKNKVFCFTHGTTVRIHSSYSAKAELERHGMSGISGHTHRMGSHFKSDYSGNYVWYENGCMCKLNPSYSRKKSNWQQGFSIVNFYEDNKFFVEQIPVIKHWFIWNGKLYKGE